MFLKFIGIGFGLSMLWFVGSRCWCWSHDLFSSGDAFPRLLRLHGIATPGISVWRLWTWNPSSVGDCLPPAFAVIVHHCLGNAGWSQCSFRVRWSKQNQCCRIASLRLDAKSRLVYPIYPFWSYLHAFESQVGHSWLVPDALLPCGSIISSNDKPRISSLSSWNFDGVHHDADWCIRSACLSVKKDLLFVLVYFVYFFNTSFMCSTVFFSTCFFWLCVSYLWRLWCESSVLNGMPRWPSGVSCAWLPWSTWSPACALLWQLASWHAKYGNKYYQLFDKQIVLLIYIYICLLLHLFI